METSPDPAPGPDGDDQEAITAAAATAAVETLRTRHYSTGKLTAEQARTVNKWRRELHKRRPRTYFTVDGRPPASTSDCIAAAVIALIEGEHAPEPLAVARYAVRLRSLQRDTRRLSFPGAQHVSIYLPAPAADRAEVLLAEARAAHLALVADAGEEAARRYPRRYQGEERTKFVVDRLAAEELAITVPKRIPVGTLARMAIEAWSKLPAAAVVGAAVRHSARHHVQHHRARTDMGME
ncbi:hypothetical protein [Nocardia carnea]|uniref:hypothetical protein n=1 Tax=Nocardia carnea TaxID=37328 RepID=UPI0024567316|nr:hypothetical protein [Nocardia carnea]